MKNYITIFVKDDPKIDKFLMVRSQLKGLSMNHDCSVHIAVSDGFDGINFFRVKNTFTEIEQFMNRVE